MIPTIRVSATPEEMAWEAAQRFIRAAEDAVISTGRFAVAFSGGETPKSLLRLLASDLSTKVPWDKTHVLFADERCVPPGDPESNFGMVCRELLDHVPIDYSRVYRMEGELPAQQAAENYEQILLSKFADGVDLVLLGIGEDGHTASLFPGTTAAQENPPITRFCVANHVPQKKSWRVTLTASYINRAFEVLVMATGAEKAAVIQHALEGTVSASECPIRLISPGTGRMVWLLDAKAAGMGDEPADEEVGNLGLENTDDSGED